MRRLMVTFILLTALACGGYSDGAERRTARAPRAAANRASPGRSYSLTDTAVETRGGVRLTMSYDAAAETFRGEVVNTTSATVTQVRVEIHLSNGVELGPTPRVDLAAGQSMPVELDASGQTFTSWSVHVELGQRLGVGGVRPAGSVARTHRPAAGVAGGSRRAAG